MAKQIHELTLEEKVGQLFAVGFDAVELPSRYAELLERGEVGNIILFSRNVVSPQQTARLTQSIQDAARRSPAGISAAIGIDQEGGIVVRMPENRGYTHLPGNMALGAADDETLTYRSARVMAAEMRAVGINWNYAPVLDVNNNRANPVIGVRSYGSSPDLVTRHGLAAMRGYQAGGVATSGKHFPGHGDTGTDSHLALPVIKHGRERLEAVEFAPFRAAMAAGIDSIMISHLFFPALEPTPSLPATLSRAVLTGLLRQEMGYSGVTCTDCLEMKGIAAHFSPEEIGVRAVDAGVDLLLVSHTYEAQMAMRKAVLEAVRRGRISEDRIDQSVARVLRMKEQRQMHRPQPDPDRVAEYIGLPEHRETATAVARKAVTLVWDRGVLPIPREVTLVQPRARWLSAAEDARVTLPALYEALENAGVTLRTADVPWDGTSTETYARAGETVVVGLAGATIHRGQADVVRRHKEAGCKVIAVARRLPYDLSLVQDIADAGIAVYDDSPAMLRALADLLLGRLEPQGRLPIEA